MNEKNESTALTLRTSAPPLARSFEEMLTIGKTLLDSGFLPVAIKTPAQAVAIIVKGRELGLPEMQSLGSINIIQGKPTLSAELMLALARGRAGVTVEEIESSDTVCILKFQRPGQKPHTETFTMEDAAKLGLKGKDNYIKQPATMLRWRCISAAMRFYASDVLAGCVYTPEELGAVVNSEGEVLALPPSLPPDIAPGELKVESEEPIKTPVNGEFIEAMRKERERIGKENYIAALGIAGYESAEQILEKPRQVEVWKALRALPAQTRTEKVKAKVKTRVLDGDTATVKATPASSVPLDKDTYSGTGDEPEAELDLS